MSAPERFLLIDDDPLNNFLNEIIIGLAEGDSEIITFTDPNEGLDFIKKSYSPNVKKRTVMLLDINMPQMTAWDFLEQFESLPSTVQQQFENYILSSSVNSQSKKIAALYPVIKGYIEKPLSKQVLNELCA